MERFFNSSGSFVAFRRSKTDRFLFDSSGNWIGWFPWGDEQAVDQSGSYLGTVVRNRLLKDLRARYRGYPGYPGYPGYAGYPGYPGFAGYVAKPAMFDDIEEERLKG